MGISFQSILTLIFTLFAIIDIIGIIPVLISIEEKSGHIDPLKATAISGALMIIFLYLGDMILGLLGIGVHSFAVGGSIIIFLIGIEMVLGQEIFKNERSSSAVLVPVAFPLIAGSGTLTTIIALRASYNQLNILIAIVVNLIIVFVVIKLLKQIKRVLGDAILIGIRKFFGIILLAIAIKIFSENLSSFKMGNHNNNANQPDTTHVSFLYHS